MKTIVATDAAAHKEWANQRTSVLTSKPTSKPGGKAKRDLKRAATTPRGGYES